MQATRTDQPSASPVAPPPPLSLQTRMVLLSYFAYFFYYFCRKHLGVATPAMVNSGISDTTIGWVQTAYGVCYAIGQFLSGALGDRLGPRIALTTGMILSGIASLAFGLFPIVGVLVIALSLNGLFQSTGWSNSCKVVAEWVNPVNRGKVMGFWTTCYIFGSIAANVVAGTILARYGWHHVFLFTGITVAVVGVIQGIFLINRPADRGYAIELEERSSPATDNTRSGFMLMIRQPAVLLLGLAYTGLKYVRYTVFSWSPYYLVSSIGLAEESAAYASNGLEIGGILGLLLGGWVGDRFFPGNRVRLALFALIGMIGAILLYRVTSGTGGLWGNLIGLGAIGLFLYIADAIVSGIAAQDIGGAENTASAAGIINGIGSTAQLFSGIVPIWLKQRWGWDAVFISFIVIAFFSCLAILPVARKGKLTKA
ncbi:MFS transporter [Luteolibacter arcticus]|uniref:MFS transporter n=1 Tax=Luteolibacter arcticus TaxID=1581411 RepID=A0ABT3GQF6_9BACT|nr:MFS transporter [Luteolibacter arcticus]MCW1925754.1 MFS transporter [Luteolibacter arcticus]